VVLVSRATLSIDLMLGGSIWGSNAHLVAALDGEAATSNGTAARRFGCRMHESYPPGSSSGCRWPSTPPTASRPFGAPGFSARTPGLARGARGDSEEHGQKHHGDSLRILNSARVRELRRL
jgi:hypothetical protein